jgi:hypothetical protein
VEALTAAAIHRRSAFKGAQVSDNLVPAIVGAAIGALITLVVFVWKEWRESRHRREDAERALAYRRDQYLVESSADLATRVWHAIRKVERLEAETTVPWGEIYEILLDLSVELLGQAPRYRLAGVEAASQEIFVQLNGFCQHGRWPRAWPTPTGPCIGCQEAYAEAGTAASHVESEVPAAVGFDDTDVDRALELFRQKTFEQMRNRVGPVLEAVSRYQPGQRFELEENREPYSNFGQAWADVKKETKAKDESQSAVE